MKNTKGHVICLSLTSEWFRKERGTDAATAPLLRHET